MKIKDIKNTKRGRVSSQTLIKKSKRKAKASNISGGKRQSEELEELAYTWDEDLCE